MKILVCTDSSAQSMKAAQWPSVLPRVGAEQWTLFMSLMDLHFHDIHHTISPEHYEIMQKSEKKKEKEFWQKQPKYLPTPALPSNHPQRRSPGRNHY